MEKQGWEQSEKRKSQKKEDAGARKVEKSQNTVLFLMFCGPRGPKSRLALKRRVRSHLAEMRDEQFPADVVRSTCQSHNAKNASEHFWKLRCGESARRFGAKHILMSNCLKPRLEFGTLLEVEMWKKCTLLQCQAHFEVNTLKVPLVRTTLGHSRPGSDNYATITTRTTTTLQLQLQIQLHYTKLR